jgi:sigma-B regulation protein RsbU (phosphoserine phosphatase)
MDKQKIILIVDDQQPDLDVLVDLLNPDYRIVTATSGEQALAAVGADIPPDLILLGNLKPEMEGSDLCRRLNANQSTRDIPLILIVSNSEPGELESGAVDCITKPISPAILKARIKTHLDLHKKVDELREANLKIETLKNSMEKELTVGREIQERIVPSDFPAFPDHDEFDVYATLQPAREFDGDFYDFFLVGDDRFCFCIGNVAGKGVQAALFMSVTKTIIKSRAGDDFSTASILTHVNEQLSAVNPGSMLVMLFMGILNIKTGKLIYSNVGHNPPCLKRETGAIERLDQIHGPLIGTARGMVYREDQTTLSKNDLLLLCSGGVTRAGIGAEKGFSEKRLGELLSSREYESVQHIVRSAISEVKKIAGTADQVEDMTLLAIQFTRNPEETGSPKLELTIPNRLSENARVKEHFDTFVEHYGIPDPIRLKMHVVIDELLMNIISYAYPDDGRHEICIKVELSADRLKVSMVDDGIPFNPLGIETPDTELSLEEREIGGLGIHLIRKMMDRVSYRRRIDKNVISVMKFLNADSSIAE